MRDALEKTLLKSPEERRRKRTRHPFDKFRCHSLIIRDVEDTLYPEIDPEARVSGWHRLELFDFYHDGLEVVLGDVRVAQNGDGGWYLLTDDSSETRDGFRSHNAVVIGQIPYRNISEIDSKGDKYYREPHLYCAFVEAGRPWEAVRHALVGSDDENDWPLELQLQVH